MYVLMHSKNTDDKWAESIEDAVALASSLYEIGDLYKVNEVTPQGINRQVFPDEGWATVA